MDSSGAFMMWSRRQWMEWCLMKEPACPAGRSAFGGLSSSELNLKEWGQLNNTHQKWQRLPFSGLDPHVRQPRKSKIFRWKEQGPEGRLMFYISQWGKCPEKYKLSLLIVPCRLVRPVETPVTAVVLFFICFDRNVN